MSCLLRALNPKCFGRCEDGGSSSVVARDEVPKQSQRKGERLPRPSVEGLAMTGALAQRNGRGEFV